MLFSVWPLVGDKVYLLVTKTKNSEGFITSLHFYYMIAILLLGSIMYDMNALRETGWKCVP